MDSSCVAEQPACSGSVITVVTAERPSRGVSAHFTSPLPCLTDVYGEVRGRRPSAGVASLSEIFFLRGSRPSSAREKKASPAVEQEGSSSGLPLKPHARGRRCGRHVGHREGCEEEALVPCATSEDYFDS